MVKCVQWRSKQSIYIPCKKNNIFLPKLMPYKWRRNIFLSGLSQHEKTGRDMLCVRLFLTGKSFVHKEYTSIYIYYFNENKLLKTNVRVIYCLKNWSRPNISELQGHKSVDWRISCCSDPMIDGFWGSKIATCLAGLACFCITDHTWMN